jgi:3',5'-cyclic AMP phosphodiesterase CpdA
MTKVVITSDLHLGITLRYEIDAMIAEIAAENPDLTIIAGDIGEGMNYIPTCLRLFRGLPGQVAALAGNHDVWALDGSHSADVWEHALPDAVRDAGMLWLEDSIWRSDGLAILGSIAWYDYTGADASIPPQSEQFWIDKKRTMHPDARFLDWPWTDRDFAARCGDQLVTRLEAVEADPTVTDVLVVTHVPLFREQLTHNAAIPNWGYGNAFFGNLTLGERVRQAQKVRAVVSGHTHIGRTETLADERALPVWVIPSDFHKPKYVVFEAPGGLRL